MEVPISYLGQAACLPDMRFSVPVGGYRAMSASFQTALILLSVAVKMALYEEILIASLNEEHVSFIGLYSAYKLATATIWRYACSFTASVLRSELSGRYSFDFVLVIEGRLGGSGGAVG